MYETQGVITRQVLLSTIKLKDFERRLIQAQKEHVTLHREI